MLIVGPPTCGYSCEIYGRRPPRVGLFEETVITVHKGLNLENGRPGTQAGGHNTVPSCPTPGKFQAPPPYTISSGHKKLEGSVWYI